MIFEKFVRKLKNKRAAIDVFMTQENGGQSMKLVVYKGFNDIFDFMIQGRKSVLQTMNS